MKLALGMLDCQEGNICIGGLSPNQMSYQNYPKNIFYLPQDDAVYPLSSIELYSMLLEDDSLKQADIILQRFGITQELFEKKISDLSGGERKKVFLSLAFSIEPKLLVMDEPTNSLDAKSRDELLYLLRIVVEIQLLLRMMIS